jgi:hypothetical protein
MKTKATSLAIGTFVLCGTVALQGETYEIFLRRLPLDRLFLRAHRASRERRTGDDLDRHER